MFPHPAQPVSCPRRETKGSLRRLSAVLRTVERQYLNAKRMIRNAWLWSAGACSRFRASFSRHQQLAAGLGDWALLSFPLEIREGKCVAVSGLKDYLQASRINLENCGRQS